MDRRQWDGYKNKVLAAFKRGDVRLLFGNTAVSVGIDNERINYVINYHMPQSMEAYYQQCGRAGRAGQDSHCYLIFSDDRPLDTQRWLDREIRRMPRRYDDLGTVAYFHQSNFPGEDADVEGAMRVFSRLFSERDERGMVDVPQYLHQGMAKYEAERTERYLSFWLMLGVITDYEVTGMDRNTFYAVRRSSAVEQFLQTRDEGSLEQHLIGNLHAYVSRYRPVPLQQIRDAVRNGTEAPLSARAVSYLVSFIYREIEYQRRESIRTMVSYCHQRDTSPERLRSVIRAYFDRSEVFSDGLAAMADEQSHFGAVDELLAKVSRVDDAEQLYWETRRLLDERFRADRATANLFAVIYRERGLRSGTGPALFADIVEALESESPETSQRIDYLSRFFARIRKLDDVFGEPISENVLSRFVSWLYQNRRLTYVTVIDSLQDDQPIHDHLTIQIATEQLKEMADAGYSRAIG